MVACLSISNPLWVCGILGVKKKSWLENHPTQLHRKLFQRSWMIHTDRSTIQWIPAHVGCHLDPRLFRHLRPGSSRWENHAVANDRWPLSSNPLLFPMRFPPGLSLRSYRSVRSQNMPLHSPMLLWRWSLESLHPLWLLVINSRSLITDQCSGPGWANLDFTQILQSVINNSQLKMIQCNMGGQLWTAMIHFKKSCNRKRLQTVVRPWR